jgi:outer membrane cobalamin receptor
MFRTLLVLFPAALAAQSTATLTGRVLDPTGAAIPGATVTVRNEVTRFARAVETEPDGSYVMTNIPYHSYQVVAVAPGFDQSSQTVSLRTNIPFALEIRLSVAGAQQAIEVTAMDRRLLVDAEETGTHVQMNQSDIEKMALSVGNRGLEAVLVSFPGFAQNANGAIHPRGAHNQMTFVVDGMPISDQLTGAFANAVDPNIVQTVEMFTGNIPAEYGNKVSAVANVTTKTGAGSGRKATGSAQVAAAGFNTYSTVIQGAGEFGKVGYSASYNGMKSQRYLDQVSLDNLHNGGHNQRGFTRFDWMASNRDILRFTLMAGSAPFQLANQRSQHANGMNQRQLLRDFSSAIAWVRTIDARSTWDTNVSFRAVSAQLFDSPFDIPVTASQARRHSTFTVANRYNTIRGRHNIRAGFDYQRYPVRENFSFAITDPDFNDPEGDSFNPNLLPYDLTRGGQRFYFGARDSGFLASGYVQDNVRYGRFQLSLGLRYDAYVFLAKGYQMQPRLGLSYEIKETGTVLRASYNRLFQTPPIENLLLSNSAESAALAPPGVRETFGGIPTPIIPERQNFFEVGLQQALFGRFSLNASYYHKNATDQQDNNNFFDTGIIFPITLAKIRVNGAEGRINAPEWKGFSGAVSFTHARAISTPPFTGGLFIGNEAVEALSQGPFVIDHDQKLGVHGILNWASKRGVYTNLSIRYDSGLVANPSDPEQVAADPDFFDLLPYVNLESTPARVRPRTVTDIVAGYQHTRDGRPKWDVAFQCSNLFDVTALYNFQSIFVGTRLVQPRTAGVRLRWYF